MIDLMLVYVRNKMISRLTIILIALFGPIHFAYSAKDCPEELASATGYDYYGYPIAQSPSTPMKPPYGFPDQTRVTELRQFLEREIPRLQTQTSVLNTLAERATEIHSLGEAIDGGEGVNHWGVYEVPGRENTLTQDCALKIGTQELEKIAVGLVLQEALSMVGKSPKIQGIYQDRSLQTLLRRFKLKKRRSEQKMAQAAILMDQVKDGWLFQHLFTPTPDFLPDLDEEKVRTQLSMFQHLLNDLGIQAIDVQFLITETSDVYLIDLERFQWRSESGKIYGYELEVPQPFELNNFSDLKRLFSKLHRHAEKHGPGFTHKEFYP